MFGFKQSGRGKYNLISVRFDKFSKRFLCVRGLIFLQPRLEILLRKKCVREAGVSLPHQGPPEIPLTSQQYETEGFKGRPSPHHHAERRQSLWVFDTLRKLVFHFKLNGI